MPYRRCAAFAAAVASTLLLVQCGANTPSGPSGGGGGGGGGDQGPSSSVINAAGDIGECGFGALETGRILDGLSGSILALGDLAYMEGSTADFGRCYDPAWGRHKSRTKPVPGNHEYETDRAARGYYDYFASLTFIPRNLGFYAFNEGPWRVIALNDNIPFGPGSDQMQWLREELEGTRKLCTLVYWHKPLFSSGPNGTINDGAGSKVLWSTLMEFGVDVVLNGHDHEYERFAPQDQDGRPTVNGVREFVVGTGGAHAYTPQSLKPNSEFRASNIYGILRLNLFATSYHWDFHTGVNTIIDRGDGACH